MEHRNKILSDIRRLEIRAALPNLSQQVLLWTPTQVHLKLAAVIPLVNFKMPKGVFLQHTQEMQDDIPIVRVLLGVGDPYTAERLGSFAFFSTQRGMEWYAKQFGATDFVPHSGMVYITYFDDREHKEEPAGLFNLFQSDQEWASQLLTLLGVSYT